MILHLDYETKNHVSIDTGAYKYSETAEILCATLMDAKTQEIFVYDAAGVDFKQDGVCMINRERLSHMLESASHLIAHNANFERCVTKSCLGLDLPISKWKCTAVKAAANGLPRSLGGAGKALNLSHQKDEAGKLVMLKCCTLTDKARKEFSTFPGDIRQTIAYNIDDVLAEAALDHALPDISREEQKRWELDQRINDRGIKADVASAKAIARVLQQVEAELTERLQQLTCGEVQTAKQNAALGEWLKANGQNVQNVQKATIERLQRKSDLPPIVAEVLDIRKTLALSSVSKIQKLLDCVCQDGRIRGTLMYHGAHTGRWAGRLIQVQNLPRGILKPKEVDTVLGLFHKGDIGALRSMGDVFALASSCIRGLLVPRRGHRFIFSDYNAIEARGLAWLACQENILEIFRRGEDVYKYAASDIYKIHVDKVDGGEQRTLGKVATLGLGYGMGGAKFKTTAENPPYNLKMDLKFAEKVKSIWRSNNSKIVKWWKDLERAAVKAAKCGVLTNAGPVTFALRDENFLECRLPSGRVMTYFQPEIIQKMAPWGELTDSLQAFNPSHDDLGKDLYGGKLAENVTQAVCCDVMAEGMARLEYCGYPCVMTVHDEIGAEVPEGYGSEKEFSRIMSIPPAWAKGFPIAAKGWAGYRYRKD